MQIYFQKMSISVPNMLFLLKNLQVSVIFLIFATNYQLCCRIFFLSMEYLSQECYDKMQAELEQLMKIEFPKVTREIAEARAQGDLSENFEYHAAKRAQGKLMGRIRFLQRVLQYAKVIDKNLLADDVAGLFRRVHVTNVSNGTCRVYTIVNPHEANLAEGKLSVKSPVGAALSGGKVGDIVEVTVPAGTLKLRIDNVEIG